MPLVELDARTAWDNMFSVGGLSRWPGGGARLLPLATPDFEATFQVPRASKVFTIGSCFARNIEHYLELEGYDIPARRHFGKAEIMNKYNSYSMLQDVRRALGLGGALTDDQRLMQVSEDGWFDVHLHQSQPFSRRDCEALSEASNRLFKEIVDCPFFIITLGLAEAWFDTETNSYINEPVHFDKYCKEEGFRTYFMNRLVFRVLSYDEVFSSTQELISLLRTASPECKIVLTVSPVPLAGTFTGKDVLVANTYSKAVLRSAAEAICYNYNFIDYFPSYESVMLSPRDSTWEQDGVHVKTEVVELNVRRMLERYVSDS